MPSIRGEKIALGKGGRSGGRMIGGGGRLGRRGGSSSWLMAGNNVELGPLSEA